MLTSTPHTKSSPEALSIFGTQCFFCDPDRSSSCLCKAVNYTYDALKHHHRARRTGISSLWRRFDVKKCTVADGSTCRSFPFPTVEVEEKSISYPPPRTLIPNRRRKAAFLGRDLCHLSCWHKIVELTMITFQNHQKAWEEPLSKMQVIRITDMSGALLLQQ